MQKYFLFRRPGDWQTGVVLLLAGTCAMAPKNNGKVYVIYRFCEATAVAVVKSQRWTV